MDQMLPNVLRFDRFVLDPSRSCVTTDGQSVVLRPKTFALLRCLCEHAGQLVSKEALYLAVWPDVVVGDDSLSQCVHELRQALGDDDRQLIKTIPRRGYLLDALPLDVAGAPDRRQVQLVDSERGRASNRLIARVRCSGWQGVLMLAIALLTIGSAGLVWREALSELLPRQVAVMLGVGGDNIIPQPDARRVADLAAEKELPLPAYRIHSPGADVAVDARKFIGVWVSSTGWVNSNRQFMLIVTNVDRSGAATGYLVNGPAKPHSHTPGPAFAGPFRGTISSGVLRYDGGAGMHLAALKDDGRIEFKLVFQDGSSGFVMLDPAWTLPQSSAALRFAR